MSKRTSFQQPPDNTEVSAVGNTTPTSFLKSELSPELPATGKQLYFIHKLQQAATLLQARDSIVDFLDFFRCNNLFLLRLNPENNIYYCENRFGLKIKITEVNPEDCDRKALDIQPGSSENFIVELKNCSQPNYNEFFQKANDGSSFALFSSVNIQDRAYFVVITGNFREALEQLSQSNTTKTFFKVLISAYEYLIDSEKSHREKTLLENALHETSEFVCTWSKKDGLIYHNRGCWGEDICADPNPEMDGVFGVAEFFDDFSWSNLHKQLDQQLRRGSSFCTEYVVIDQQKQERTLRSKITVTSLDSDGSAASFVAVTRDITEQVRSAEDIKYQAELEHWVLTAIGELFASFNQQAVTDIFKSLGEYLGVDRCHARDYEGHGQSKFYSGWHSPHVSPFNDIAPNLKYIKPSSYLEERLRSGRGAYIDDIDERYDAQGAAYDRELKDFLSLSKSKATIIVPALFKNEIVGLVSVQNCQPRVWSDIEKRVVELLAKVIGMVLFQDKLLTRLKFSDRRFELALSAAGQGFWEINVPENRFYLSSTHFAMLGYPANAFEGRYNLKRSYMHPEDQAFVSELIGQIKKGAISEFNREIRHFKQDGSIAWVLTKAKVVKWDDNNQPLTIMGVDIDITKFKNIELDLQIAAQEADAAKTAKSEFLARMSHEIRTPMNAVIGLNLLLMQTDLNQQQREYADNLATAANRLLETINDVLDFSKIEANKFVLDRHEFNTQDFFDEIVQKHFEECRSKDIAFNLTRADNVPDRIVADSTRLAQIIDNLLSNAIKFTKHGYINCLIDFESSPSLKKLKVKVEDTGIGMEDEHVQLIFDAFTQVDGSSTRAYGGTGLGLTITRRLIEMMGGEINIDTQRGVGTMVSFFIVCSTEQTAQSDLPHSIAAHTDKPLAQMRVLLAEDNIVNQKVAKGILTSKGVTVVIANNGREALYISKAVEENFFDAIFMDVEMPFMDGLTATAAIRTLDAHKHTPIIAMTAHNLDGERQAYLKAGMTTTLSKPVDPETLFQCLNQWGKR